MRLVISLIFVLGFSGVALCGDDSFIIYKDDHQHCSVLQSAGASPDQLEHRVGKSTYDNRQDADIDVLVLCDNSAHEEQGESAPEHDDHY